MTPDGDSLFSRAARARGGASSAPLSDRMRPRHLDEVAGQRHLIGPGKWLRCAIEQDRPFSLIFWGPPGVGKTTLAHVIAASTRRRFVPFSAVLGGLPELRAILKEAMDALQLRGEGTVLFVDEIHRFNKAQQDAFLPHVERGTITLIGATTENPSFAVNGAVLSRAKALRLHALSEDDLLPLLERALADPERGVARSGIRWTDAALRALARAADGDARRALNLLETAVELCGSAEPEQAASRSPDEVSDREPPSLVLDVERLASLLDDSSLLYDRSGEEHYNVVSAWIKSMRGSDPDAAIYWLMRMVEAGEDPLFLLRRLMIFASEDVGNADPRALGVATAADHAFRRMGLPEGLYPLAHACLYLASCPKSGAVGSAYHAAREAIERYGTLEVPLKLRNAVTGLMRREGYGSGYRYAHDFDQGFAPGEHYLPEPLVGRQFYRPTQHGLEKAIGERLERVGRARQSNHQAQGVSDEPRGESDS